LKEIFAKPVKTVLFFDKQHKNPPSKAPEAILTEEKPVSYPFEKGAFP